MQPWTEAYADIVVGVAIIVAVAAVFVVAPVATQTIRDAVEPPYADVTSIGEAAR